MKFLTNIKLVFHLARTSKSHAKLMATKNLNDNHFQSVLQVVTQFEKFLDQPANAQFWLCREVVDFVKKDIQFIKNFNSHNFENCFKIASSMKGETTVAAIWNRRIDSLMEIKARMPQEEFKDKYGEKETILKANINSFSAKQKTKSYNGTNMALAFGAYLDGNQEEMQFYLDKQVTTYGLAEIVRHEGTQEQAWYYNNVTPKYIEFLTKFFEREATSENKSTGKMKPA